MFSCALSTCILPVFLSIMLMLFALQLDGEKQFKMAPTRQSWATGNLLLSAPGVCK